MEDYALAAVRKRTRHEISLAQIVPIVCLLVGIAIVFLLPLAVQLIYIAVCAANGAAATREGYIEFVTPIATGNGSLVLNIFVSILLLMPGALIYGGIKRKKGLKLIGNAKAPFLPFVVCYLLATAASGVVSYITDILILFLQSIGLTPAIPDFTPPETITSDPLTIVLYVLSVAVMPALLEEFTFRGVYICDLKRRAPYAAIFLSGIAFSFAHGNIAQIPSAFVFGAVAAYFAIRYDCVWIGVVAHFINNLTSVVLLTAYSFAGENETAVMTVTTVFNLLSTVRFVTAAAVTVIFFVFNGIKLKDKGYGGYGVGGQIGAVFQTPGFYVMLAAATAYFVINNIYA